MTARLMLAQDFYIFFRQVKQQINMNISPALQLSPSLSYPHTFIFIPRSYSFYAHLSSNTRLKTLRAKFFPKSLLLVSPNVIGFKALPSLWLYVNNLSHFHQIQFSVFYSADFRMSQCSSRRYEVVWGDPASRRPFQTYQQRCKAATRTTWLHQREEKITIQWSTIQSEIRCIKYTFIEKLTFLQLTGYHICYWNIWIVCIKLYVSSEIFTSQKLFQINAKLW